MLTPRLHHSRSPSGSSTRASLVEIKYRHDLKKQWPRLRPAFQAAREWALENGVGFRIVTERMIRRPQLEAAKRLLPLRFAPVDAELAAIAVAAAHDQALTFSDLVDMLPPPREAGLAVVWRLIARGALVVDFLRPIGRETHVIAP
jgi:hypothetical protein